MAQNDAGIKWALGALQQHADDYRLASDYYEGKQRLVFATDKFRNAFGQLFREFSINHCAVCVDVPADRLQIEGFKVLAEGEADAPDAETTLDAKWQEIWRRNRMKKRSGEVHAEMLRSGDAYIIVDWLNDKATIHPNVAGRCAVLYDEETPGIVKQAARWWIVPEAVGNRFCVRLNLYYPDRIEKYQSKPRTSTDLCTRSNEYEPISGDATVPNPYGKVPVFHFANNADTGCLGRSELASIIPLQDGLNKAVCDAMVGAEYAVMGQRYVVNLSIEEDANGRPIPPFRDGLANLWVAPPPVDADGAPLPADQAPPVSFGQFTAANLEQLLSVKSEFRSDISTVSGIPAHYFMQAAGGWPSGEALKTAETRLAAKVADRQLSSGGVWEDVMRFCLQIEGQDDVQLETMWHETGPKDTTADVQNAAIKREKLDYPREVIWEELGAKPSEIEDWKQKKLDEASDAYNAENMVSVPTVAGGVQ